MKCSEIMTEDPVCCLPDDSVMKAAQLMKRENVGSIPIVKDYSTNMLIGIVTDRDLALSVIAEGLDVTTTIVDDVMTNSVIACRTDDDIEIALDMMEEHQIRRLPIIEEHGRIVGIISQADIATRLEEPERTAEMVEEISKSQAAGKEM
jgi:CBS domain-containing protein